METTRELLERAREACAPPTYYRLAKVLGVSQARVSQWKAGHTFGDEMAVKVAELIGLDPAYVLACVQAERTTDGEARRAWARLAGLVASLAVLAVLAAAPYSAADVAVQRLALCIMSIAAGALLALWAGRLRRPDRLTLPQAF